MISAKKQIHVVVVVLLFYVHGKHQILGSCRDGQLLLVVLLFYVHGKHLRSCRDGQLT